MPTHSVWLGCTRVVRGREVAKGMLAIGGPWQWLCRCPWHSTRRWALSTITNQLSINTSNVKASSLKSRPAPALLLLLLLPAFLPLSLASSLNPPHRLRTKLSWQSHGLWGLRGGLWALRFSSSRLSILCIAVLGAPLLLPLCRFSLHRM